MDSDPPGPEGTQTLYFPSLARVVDFQELAATSDGGFYAQRASHSTLRKYCGDGRIQWELLGVHRAENMMVEADDSVWIPGASPATGYQAVRIDVTGREVERIPFPEGADGTGMGVMFAGDLTVVNVLASDGRGLLVVGRRDGREVWRLSLPDATTGAVTTDPRGGVWLATGVTRESTLFVDASPVLSMSTAGPFGQPMGQDGSFITDTHTDGALAGIRRVEPSGTIAWTLPIEQPFAYMTHDVDGRVYLYGSGYVIAVQTDVLPPSVRGCWQHRCSPRGDNRIEPLP